MYRKDHYELLSFTEIPETLSRSTKLLAIKIWTESQQIANKELESQREVLQQAAKLSAERVKEAEAFSDEQAKRLEEIERSYGQEIETHHPKPKDAELIFQHLYLHIKS